MMAPNQRFSQGLHKPLQLLQSWSPFGEITPYLLDKGKGGALIISIFLYACELWTLTAELEKKTQTFEMRCYRRLLNTLYKDHVTSEEVHRKIQAATGERIWWTPDPDQETETKMFSHVSKSSGLAKTTFIHTFSCFSEKIRFDISYGRGFAWNIKPYFLRKIKVKKKIVPSAAILFVALSVKSMLIQHHCINVV